MLSFILEIIFYGYVLTDDVVCSLCKKKTFLHNQGYNSDKISKDYVYLLIEML